MVMDHGVDGDLHFVPLASAEYPRLIDFSMLAHFHPLSLIADMTRISLSLHRVLPGLHLLDRSINGAIEVVYGYLHPARAANAFDAGTARRHALKSTPGRHR